MVFQIGLFIVSELGRWTGFLGYGIGYMTFGVRGCEVVHMILKLSLKFASKLLPCFDFGIPFCIAWLSP